ncbi:MAG: T9SS type A sorting domain-containing protein [Marinilabiliaceae bacterium]|nr:T9SS type A sorting domain-containing protein [Marinilabiliaceae bacterium]
MSFFSSESFKNGEATIDISHLPAGIYFVKVGNEMVKKIITQQKKFRKNSCISINSITNSWLKKQ